MPRYCHVSGSFTQDGRPVMGMIRFTPSRLWVVEDGIHWACLAHTQTLDEDGSFDAFLTPTDTDRVPWHYIVESPAGLFNVLLPQLGQSYSLRELVDHCQVRPWRKE